MWRAILVALTCAGLGACQDSSPSMPNVLLISIDTLRADRLGCYGYERPTSPFLDSLAAGGTLFESATAQSPWTLPSHATMLTGLLPHRHGVIDESRKLGPEVPTLATLMRDRGYTTAGFVNSHWLSQQQGLKRGFDQFQRLDEEGNKGPAISALALRWLDEREDEQPFLMFLHYYDVHSSYEPMTAFRQQFTRPYDGTANGTTEQLNEFRHGRHQFSSRDMGHVSDLYDAEIRQFDTMLAQMFGELERRGLLEDLLVVITADHGEEFMEHGGVLHGRTMYEEVLAVPLIVSGPGIEAGVRRSDPVMVADVVPTILAQVGGIGDTGFDGIDLFGPPSEEPRPAFAAADWRRAEPDSLRMVRHGRYKLHVDRLSGKHRLFDLVEDPAETRDVSSEHPELVEWMLTEMQSFLRPRHQAGDVGARSEDALETLRALGYFDE